MSKPLKTQTGSPSDSRGVFVPGANPLRVGLYARVSTHDQKTLPLQLAAMRDYAAKRNWAVAVEVQDVGSGATTRPQRAGAGRYAGRVCGVRAGYFAGSRESGNRPSPQSWKAAWTALDRWQTSAGNETSAAGGAQLSGNRPVPGGQPRLGDPVAADYPVNRRAYATLAGERDSLMKRINKRPSCSLIDLQNRA